MKMGINILTWLSRHEKVSIFKDDYLSTDQLRKGQLNPCDLYGYYYLTTIPWLENILSFTKPACHWSMSQCLTMCFYILATDWMACITTIFNIMFIAQQTYVLGDEIVVQSNQQMFLMVFNFVLVIY